MSNVVRLKDYREPLKLINKMKVTTVSLFDIISEIGDKITNDALLTFYTALTLDPKSVIGKTFDQQYSEFITDKQKNKSSISNWLGSQFKTIKRDCDLYLVARTQEGKTLEFQFFGINDEKTNFYAISNIDDYLVDWNKSIISLLNKLDSNVLRNTIRKLSSKYPCCVQFNENKTEIILTFTNYSNTRIVISDCKEAF